MMAPYTLPALILLLVGAILYRIYTYMLPKPIPGIPYDEPASRNILGNIPELVKMLKETGRSRPFFRRHVEKHQSALTQVFLTPLGLPSLILADFRETQDILLRRFREFDKGDKATTAFKTVIPEHHISMPSKDGRFKGNRELVRDLMTPGFLHEVSAPEIHAKTMTLIDLWTLKTSLGRGKPFDAQRDISDAAMDIINAAAFGIGDEQSTVKHQLDHLRASSSSTTTTTTTTPSKSERESESESDIVASFPSLPQLADIAAVEEVSRYLGEQFKAPFPLLAHKINMLTNGDLRRNFKRKNEFLHREIDNAVERLKKGNGNGKEKMRSAMDFILSREMNLAEKEGREPVFHAPRIHDELFGYIIGGHDTTSTALAWMIKNMADYPAIQTNLRTALQKAYPSNHHHHQPTASEICKTPIPYLDAVLEESFRFNSPIPVTVREAVTDTQILGHVVPAGTAVFFVSDGPSYQSPSIPLPLPLPNSTTAEKSTTSTNTHGEWDPQDMHLFKPERWLKTPPPSNPEGKEETFDPKAGPLLAFSLGPRMCFGKRLAYLETRIVLALLVWNFRFEKLPDGLSSREAFDAITTSPVQCFVRLTKIT
ncbi:cytochrome P450 [Poronia punctata]|nr:cytochrome P450 [Poronia punctata]